VNLPARVSQQGVHLPPSRWYTEAIGAGGDVPGLVHALRAAWRASQSDGRHYALSKMLHRSWTRGRCGRDLRARLTNWRRGTPNGVAIGSQGLPRSCRSSAASFRAPRTLRRSLTTDWFVPNRTRALLRRRVRRRPRGV